MLNTLLLTLILAICGLSQELTNEPVKIPDFTLPNVVNGSDFSLSQFNNAKAVAVIFTSHRCPYAKLYENRVSKLIDQYKGQNVRFILINSTNHQKNAPDLKDYVSRIADEDPLSVPYLNDSKQEVADLFGARKTPEAFLLRKSSNNTFEIVYRGAIDDNPQVASDVNHPFLKDAIDATLRGSLPLQASHYPTGCMIKR